jgi:hypothetical protein
MHIFSSEYPKTLWNYFNFIDKLGAACGRLVNYVDHLNDSQWGKGGMLKFIALGSMRQQPSENYLGRYPDRVN